MATTTTISGVAQEQAEVNKPMIPETSVDEVISTDATKKVPVAETIVVQDEAVKELKGSGSSVIDLRKGLPMDLDSFKPSFRLRQKQEVTMRWENISLTIKKRQILNNISGAARPREVMAIMGPSGAGKSTLLNALAGRVIKNSKNKLSGDVLVNGAKISPFAFRKRIAYVLQADALFATSTTREALDFSARLRLPRSFPANERKELVDNLLETLGLWHVQDSYIGSDLIRGLSGGEKKRAAVGVELVTNPSVLFLDEPTSGLDSYSALLLMKVLHAIADSGCTILCTIHQPSSEIFNSFNKLLLLSKGQVVYGGPINGLNPAWAKVGLPIPQNTNPADHIMFMAQTRPIDALPCVNTLAEGLVSSDGTSIVDPKAEILTFESTSSFFTQCWQLAKREFQNIFRDKAGLIGRFGGTFFLNLLIAGIFFGNANPDTEGYTVQSHFGALTQVYIGALFGASQPVLLTFPLERITFVREYATGTYGSAAYLVSKLLVELPINLLTSFVVWGVAYPMMQFQGNFILLVLSTWVLMLAASSTSLVVGALVSDPKAVQEVAPLIFVPQLLFIGFFVQIDQIPEVLRWVQYLCSAKWAINLGLIIEFEDCALNCQQPDCSLEDVVNQKQCEGIFEFNNVNRDEWWVSLLVLAGIFLLFRVLSLTFLTIKARNYST